MRGLNSCELFRKVENANILQTQDRTGGLIIVSINLNNIACVEQLLPQLQLTKTDYLLNMLRLNSCSA